MRSIYPAGGNGPNAMFTVHEVEVVRAGVGVALSNPDANSKD